MLSWWGWRLMGIISDYARVGTTTTLSTQTFDSSSRLINRFHHELTPRATRRQFKIGLNLPESSRSPTDACWGHVSGAFFFFFLSLATSSGSGKNVTGRQGGDAGGHVHGGGGLVYWLGVFPGCSKWVMLPPDRPFAIGQTSTRNIYYPDVEDMLLSGLHVITWCFCFSFKLVPWSWELPL